MNYRNSEMKIDQLVSYLNEHKINLSPPFQRGHVWRLSTRRKLIQNMVEGKPIPAIFLYKQESGTRYLYNILDGKQRIESLILFIASSSANLSITKWQDYFFSANVRRMAKFAIKIQDREMCFVDLDEARVRDFAEYVIPTIEITLEDTTTLDEVISLFVDINQQGAPVTRFQIVKAIRASDPLLKSAFDLIAVKERRREDEVYKMKNNDITAVMKRLAIVKEEEDIQARVERMWQRLIELVLFAATGTHRKPSLILRGMIQGKIEEQPASSHVQRLRKTFKQLREAYRTTTLGSSRFAEDATYFYDMVTYLLSIDPASVVGAVPALVRFSDMIGLPKEQRQSEYAEEISGYVGLVSKQTTDVSRRKQRQDLISEIITKLLGEKQTEK